MSKKRVSEAIEKHKVAYGAKKGTYPAEELSLEQFDPYKYGNRIRQLRKIHGLTQRKCGEYVGISKNGISLMEKGEMKQLNLDIMYLFCVLFNTFPRYLLGLTDNIKETYEPIRFDEREVLDLSTEFSSNLIMVRNLYFDRPELCKQLLAVIRSADSELLDMLERVITGLYVQHNILRRLDGVFMGNCENSQEQKEENT